MSDDRLFLLSPAGKEISSYDLDGNHLFDAYLGDQIDGEIADFTVLPSSEIVVVTRPRTAALLVVSPDGKNISQHPFQVPLTAIRVAGNHRGEIYVLGFRRDLIGPPNSLSGPFPLVFRVNRSGQILEEECWLEPLSFEKWREIRYSLNTSPFGVDERGNKYFQQTERQLTVVDEKGAARRQVLPDAGFDIQVLSDILIGKNGIDLFLMEGQNVASSKARKMNPKSFVLRNPVQRLITYDPEQGTFGPAYEVKGRLFALARGADGTLLSASHRKGKVLIFLETVRLSGAGKQNLFPEPKRRTVPNRERENR